MKIKLTFPAVLLGAALAACGTQPANQNTAAKPSPAAQNTTAVAPTPIPTSVTPKNGDYPAKGVVTKINLEAGSVELDHEEITGVMPRMIMEFYVTDKKLLDGLKVGDSVDFVLRYKDHTEKIVDITKAK